jgi:hypothetical protein
MAYQILFMLPLYNKEIAVLGFSEAVRLKNRPCGCVWYQTAILGLIRWKVRDVFGALRATTPWSGARFKRGKSTVFGLHVFLFIPRVTASCDSALR